jgi:hypothetical protein
MNTLLAQVVIEGPREQFAWGAFLMTIGVVGVVLFTVVMLAVQAHRRRSWDHAERMRMLELGLALPPHDRAVWPKAWVCMAIGAGVPLVSFVFTFSAYTGRSNAADELFVAPAIVSCLSVIAASSLAAHLFGKRAGSDAPAGEQEGGVNGRLHGEKVTGDPDAFDVAGRRG